MFAGHSRPGVSSIYGADGVAPTEGSIPQFEETLHTTRSLVGDLPDRCTVFRPSRYIRRTADVGE